jgi:hypothetical protein
MTDAWRNLKVRFMSVLSIMMVLHDVLVWVWLDVGVGGMVLVADEGSAKYEDCMLL